MTDGLEVHGESHDQLTCKRTHSPLPSPAPRPVLPISAHFLSHCGAITDTPPSTRHVHSSPNVWHPRPSPSSSTRTPGPSADSGSARPWASSPRPSACHPPLGIFARPQAGPVLPACFPCPPVSCPHQNLPCESRDVCPSRLSPPRARGTGPGRQQLLNRHVGRECTGRRHSWRSQRFVPLKRLCFLHRRTEAASHGCGHRPCSPFATSKLSALTCR